jgi:anti-anti-sigma regulatory factor
MAANFKIFVHKNSENLHLKLIGDFDGSSACELLNVLKSNCIGASKVFIHTSCLKRVHSFGREIFHKNLEALNNRSVSVLFTGEEALQLAPENNRFFRDMGYDHSTNCRAERR